MGADDFDPDGVGINNGNYFGFPYGEEQAALTLLSVPWDVTSSYGGGSAYAPDAIIEASTQLDFHDPLCPDAWRAGIATIGIDYSIQDRSVRLRADARRVMQHLESGGTLLDELLLPRKLERLNAASAELNRQVYEEAAERLRKGKIVGLVGGDHSTPFGLIRAVAEVHGPVGILHLDAHCDLRRAYEGFEWSHASIMYNVLEHIPGVERIVQVGVRDYSAAEAALAARSSRVELFGDAGLAAARFAGESWKESCARIVERLPQNVYISFDIDVLSPENCPSTGTPVPGGLGYNEAVYLIAEVVAAGKRIAGFDLCEVVPSKEGEWDANVGARVLFRLCGLALRSAGVMEKG